MIALIGLLALAGDPTSAATAPRTAFLCTINAELPQGKDKPVEVSPRKQVAFLLSSTPQTVAQDAAIETFDPDKLLAGRPFSSFHRDGDSGNKFTVTTGSSTERSAMMMMVELKPRHGKPVFDLVLGDRAPGARHLHLGYCLGLQTPDTKAEFDKFRAQGGFPK